MKKTILASCCIVISMTISIISINLTTNQQSTYSLKELELFSTANAEDLGDITVTCDQKCAKNAKCWAWSYEYCGNIGGYEGLCFFNGNQSTSCSSPCC